VWIAGAGNAAEGHLRTAVARAMQRVSVLNAWKAAAGHAAEGHARDA
jgi:hypothetical protein